MRRLLFSALLSVLAMGVAASGSLAAPRLVAARPCRGQPGYVCSVLPVPLDHAGQARGTLRLGVAVKRLPRAPRGVLVFLDGGPGEAGVEFAADTQKSAGNAFAGYRLVMFDQRGTGGGALRCPVLQAALGASDLTLAPPGTVAGCARRIGPKRRFFTTPETIADLESLRIALGARRLTLAAVSYGTFVAERYALVHPGRVARLVLDSVVPQRGIDLVPVTVFSDTARVLRQLCAAARCRYDPANDLQAVIRARGDDPGLLDLITGLSIGEASFTGLLPALRQARAGSYGRLDALIRREERLNKAPATELSQGLHIATGCLDLPPPWDPSAPRLQRAATRRRLVERYPEAEMFPYGRATAIGTGDTQYCLDWPPTTPPALPSGNPRAKLPRVPVLLLAGGRDLSTPVAWAREEAAKAPLGRLVIVPGVGHSVLLGPKGPTVRPILKRFLDG